MKIEYNLPLLNDSTEEIQMRNLSFEQVAP
jgi:hypothetical protein